MNNSPQTRLQTGAADYPHVACRLTVDGKEALLIMATRLLIREEDGSISTRIVQLAPSVAWPRRTSRKEIASIMNPDNLAAPMLPGYPESIYMRPMATGYMGYMKRLARYLENNPSERSPLSSQWLEQYRNYNLKRWNLDIVTDILSRSIYEFFEDPIMSIIERSVYDLDMGLVRFLPIYNAFARASEPARNHIQHLLEGLRWQTLPSGTLLKAILAIYESLLPYAFHHMWNRRDNILDCLVHEPETVAQELGITKSVWEWFRHYPEQHLPRFHTKDRNHVSLASHPMTGETGTEIGFALPYHEISNTTGAQLNNGCLVHIHEGEDVALMRDIYAHAARPVPAAPTAASNVRFMLIALASHLQATADQPAIPVTTPWWHAFVPILTDMVPAIEAMVERFLARQDQREFTNSWAIILAIGAYQGRQDRQAIVQACVDNDMDLAAEILGAPKDNRNLALNGAFNSASPITRRYGYPLPVATLFKHLTDKGTHGYWTTSSVNQLLNRIPSRLGQWHPARIDMTGQDFIDLKRRTLRKLEALTTASRMSEEDSIEMPGFLGHHAPEILTFLEDHKDSADRQEELTYWHSIGEMDFPPEIVDHTSFSELYRQPDGEHHRMLPNPHTIGRIIDKELNNPLFPDTSRDIVAFLDIHQLMLVSEGSIDTLLEWAVYLPTNESLEHHKRLQAEAAGLFSRIQAAIDSRNLIMPTLAWVPRLEFPLATPERPYLIGCHNNEKPLENLRMGELVRGEPRFLDFGLEKQIIAGLTGSPETDFALIVDQSYTGFTRTPHPVPPQQMLASWTRKVLDAAHRQTRPDNVLLTMAWMLVNTAYALMLTAIKIRTAMKTYNKSDLNPTLPFTREILDGPRQWRMPVLALSRSNNRTSPEFARLFTNNWSLDLMVMNKVLEFANGNRVEDMTVKANGIRGLIESMKASYSQPRKDD